MKRPISISIGPGQGGDLIVDALANAGLLNQARYTYPDLKIVKYSDSGSSEKVINSFRRLQRAVWATWRRIPYYSQFETPSGYLLPLSDSLLEKRLEPCGLFIGWLQVSLSCMKKAIVSVRPLFLSTRCRAFGSGWSL